MLSVGQNGQFTAYGGVSSGAGGLTKQGAGALTLTASQGYKGPTVIDGGLLKLQPPIFGPSIGIHFVGTGSSVTGSAGVVAMNNWNNLRGENFSSTPLTDNSGASTTAQLTTANVASAWASGSSNQLLNGYIASLSSALTVTLSGIPYSNYSIYAYLVESTQGHDEEVAIGGKTYYYSPTNAATYTQVTNTNSASYPAGNYVVASGLTGSSQTLFVQGIGEPYGSFAGFEIVNNTLNRGGILPATTPLSIAAVRNAGPCGGGRPSRSVRYPTMRRAVAAASSTAAALHPP